MKRKLLLIIGGLFMFASLIAMPMNTLGMSANQKRILDSGIPYYDVDNCSGNNGGTPNGSKVTWIGDSISVGAKSQIETKLSGVKIYAQTGKQFGSVSDKEAEQSPEVVETSSGTPSGISIIQSSKTELRDYVVFALGTNSASLSKEQVDKVIEILGSKKIVFVNNYYSYNIDDNHFKSNNDVLAAAASAHDNVALADWFAAAKNGNVAMDDGTGGLHVHPQDDNGKLLFVDTVYDALSKVWSSGGGGESGDLKGPAPTSLAGEDNYQKVWNYFKARGLSDAAAAGVMGNLKKEDSSFDPYVGEGGDTSWNMSVEGVGFGIIQWTNTGGAGADGRRGRVIQHLKNNGISTPDPNKKDAALLLELNWLWDGEYGDMTWQEDVNGETTYEASDVSKGITGHTRADNKGNGSTMMFHIAVERSADRETGLQQRITYAKEFFEKYSGTAGGGACDPNLNGNFLDDSKWIYYDQGDPQWNGNGYDFANCGCGPTSAAMIVTNFTGNKSITPPVVFKGSWSYSGGVTGSDCNGASNTAMKDYIANHPDYGLDASEFVPASEMSSAFKDGNVLLWTNVTDIFNASGSVSSTSGHFIVVRGMVDNTHYKISDPARQAGAHGVIEKSVLENSVSSSSIGGAYKVVKKK